MPPSISSAVGATSAVLGAPNISVATWNLRSLALTNHSVRLKKQRHVSTLASNNEVVILLEARASVPILLKWARQWRLSHLALCSVNAPGDTKAGILILLRKDFLTNYRIQYTFGSVFAGRVCWLMFGSPLGPPLYILVCHVERFTVSVIDAVKAQRISLGASVSHARPRPGAGLLVGDFNFVNRRGSQERSLVATQMGAYDRHVGRP